MNHVRNTSICRTRFPRHMTRHASPSRRSLRSLPLLSRREALEGVIHGLACSVRKTMRGKPERPTRPCKTPYRRIPQRVIPSLSENRRERRSAHAPQPCPEYEKTLTHVRVPLQAPATGLEPVTVRLTVRESKIGGVGNLGQNGSIPTIAPHMRTTCTANAPQMEV